MTAQTHERLILDGEEQSMAFCPPLPPDESLLAKTTIVPDEHVDKNGVRRAARLEKWRDSQGEEHCEPANAITGSTGCWRGYVGTWEIKNNQFWLVKLTGRVRLAVPGPVLADWFTGMLRVPKGKTLQYVHMGFGSVYEEELHIMIERGKVMGRRVIDNKSKEHDRAKLGWDNLPGRENRFPGDTDFN